VLTNGPILLNEYLSGIQSNISYRDAKMAEDGMTRDIEAALYKIVNTIEQWKHAKRTENDI